MNFRIADLVRGYAFNSKSLSANICGLAIEKCRWASAHLHFSLNYMTALWI